MLKPKVKLPLDSYICMILHALGLHQLNLLRTLGVSLEWSLWHHLGFKDPNVTDSSVYFIHKDVIS